MTQPSAAVASPSTSSPGDAAFIGYQHSRWAREDHKHGRETSSGGGIIGSVYATDSRVDWTAHPHNPVHLDSSLTIVGDGSWASIVSGVITISKAVWIQSFAACTMKNATVGGSIDVAVSAFPLLNPAAFTAQNSPEISGGYVVLSASTPVYKASPGDTIDITVYGDGTAAARNAFVYVVAFNGP